MLHAARCEGCGKEFYVSEDAIKGGSVAGWLCPSCLDSLTENLIDEEENE